jgi:hypothetical protein
MTEEQLRALFGNTDDDEDSLDDGHDSVDQHYHHANHTHELDASSEEETTGSCSDSSANMNAFSNGEEVDDGFTSECKYEGEWEFVGTSSDSGDEGNENDTPSKANVITEAAEINSGALPADDGTPDDYTAPDNAKLPEENASVAASSAIADNVTTKPTESNSIVEDFGSNDINLVEVEDGWISVKNDGEAEKEDTNAEVVRLENDNGTLHTEENTSDGLTALQGLHDIFKYHHEKGMKDNFFSYIYQSENCDNDHNRVCPLALLLMFTLFLNCFLGILPYFSPQQQPQQQQQPVKHVHVPPSIHHAPIVSPLSISHGQQGSAQQQVTAATFLPTSAITFRHCVPASSTRNASTTVAPVSHVFQTMGTGAIETSLAIAAAAAATAFTAAATTAAATSRVSKGSLLARNTTGQTTHCCPDVLPKRRGVRSALPPAVGGTKNITLFPFQVQQHRVPQPLPRVTKFRPTSRRDQSFIPAAAPATVIYLPGGDCTLPTVDVTTAPLLLPLSQRPFFANVTTTPATSALISRQPSALQSSSHKDRAAGRMHKKSTTRRAPQKNQNQRAMTTTTTTTITTGAAEATIVPVVPPRSMKDDFDTPASVHRKTHRQTPHEATNIKQKSSHALNNQPSSNPTTTTTATTTTTTKKTSKTVHKSSSKSPPGSSANLKSTKADTPPNTKKQGMKKFKADTNNKNKKRSSSRTNNKMNNKH